MMTLEKGRPKDTNRLPKELAVYDLLDELGIEYERIDHEALYTIEACQGADEVLGIQICKNLFLCNSQKTKFYLLLMPGDKKFVTKEVSKQIGSARLSFGPENYMEEFLNITPGSVSVMGLMNDRENRIQLLIDRDLLEDDYIGCHPCINTSSLKLSMNDIINKLLPAMGHEPVYVSL